MKLFYTFLLFLFVNVIQSQTMIGRVIDEDDNPLIGVSVFNTNTKKGLATDLKGNFTLQIVPGDYLKLSFVGKENLIYRVPANKQDTIYILFILKENIQEISEFTVSSERINKVAGDRNEYILDYIIQLDGKIVTLKKHKNDYYLSLEGIDTVYTQQKLNYPKPKRLDEDCYGNIQLFCKDSVRQFWIDRTIQCLYTYSYKSYNDFLKPLIHCEENMIIAENFTNHNKKYQLTLIEKGKQKEFIYQTWDKEAEKIAADWYYQIIRYYNANTSPEMNLIENGVWDGNVISLQVSGDLKSTQYVSWYLKVKAREMNIQSFSDDEGLLVFDLQEDSITRVNRNGKIIHKTNTDIKNINLSTFIAQDKMLDKYYYYQAEKSWLYLYEINPTTGNTSQILKLKEVTFVKNVKIHNGWLYFVRAKKKTVSRSFIESNCNNLKCYLTVTKQSFEDKIWNIRNLFSILYVQYNTNKKQTAYNIILL